MATLLPRAQLPRGEKGCPGQQGSPGGGKERPLGAGQGINCACGEPVASRLWKD